MSIYFVENEYGEYCSRDGKRRFIKLTGKQAYRYLSEHKELRFYDSSTAEDFGEKVFVEVPKHRNKKVESWKNHENYVKRTMKENKLEIVSLSKPVTKDENVSLEDIIVDHNLPFEDKVIHDLDLEVLHHALGSLNEEEYHIIDCLYLANSPMTERDLAKSMGKSQPYINRCKRKIFDKIRKFF